MSDEAPRESRNVTVLVAAQALGGASAPIIISLGGIVGQMLSTPDLATLPVSLYHLGVALSTLPAAWLMRHLGRRSAYLLGATLGGIAGLLAAIAILQGWFALFCAGTALAGFYGACVQSYRFAAADSVPAGSRPFAVSRVLMGGVVAAVIGPQLVIWTRDAMPQGPFAGSFLAQAGLALLAIPLLTFLRGIPAPARSAVQQGRTALQIARMPAFFVPVAAGMASYGSMSFLMTASPMAMVGCGHSVGEAALGIQWHVLAMFAPSFVTGKLMARFGKRPVTLLGLVLIALSGVVALSGIGRDHFWGALVLLGLGWNLSFLGATAMVVDGFEPGDRAKAQAMNDFLIFGSVALSSFGAGRMLSSSGWDSINQAAIVAVVIAMVLILLQSGQCIKTALGSQ
ncbi:MAG TPA: MFS transporter [Noviherbaspirillum sp.]|nr:MFS transporter [Noviherbaspirillum sp.]